MKTERYNLLLSVAVVLALIPGSRAFGRQDESAGQSGEELLNMPLEKLMAYDSLYPADARACAPALGVSLKYKF